MSPLRSDNIRGNTIFSIANQPDLRVWLICFFQGKVVEGSGIFAGRPPGSSHANGSGHSIARPTACGSRVPPQRIICFGNFPPPCPSAYIFSSRNRRVSDSQSAELKKAVKRSSHRTGVNLQRFSLSRVLPCAAAHIILQSKTSLHPLIMPQAHHLPTPSHKSKAPVPESRKQGPHFEEGDWV